MFSPTHLQHVKMSRLGKTPETAVGRNLWGGGCRAPGGSPGHIAQGCRPLCNQSFPWSGRTKEKSGHQRALLLVSSRWRPPLPAGQLGLQGGRLGRRALGVVKGAPSQCIRVWGCVCSQLPERSSTLLLFPLEPAPGRQLQGGPRWK